MAADAEDLLSSDEDEPYCPVAADPYGPGPGHGAADAADGAVANGAVANGAADSSGAGGKIIEQLLSSSSDDELVVVSAKLGTGKATKAKKKDKKEKKEKKEKKSKKEKSGKAKHDKRREEELPDLELVGVREQDPEEKALAASAWAAGMRLPTARPKGRGIGWLRQRRRAKQMRDADEAARSMLEESARRAAEWREGKTKKEVLAMGLERKVHAARPKKKAKIRATLLHVPEKTAELELEYEELLQATLLRGRRSDPEKEMTWAELSGAHKQKTILNLAAPPEMDLFDSSSSARTELKEMEKKLSERHVKQQALREEMLAKYAATIDDEKYDAADVAADAVASNFAEFDTYDASQAANVSFGQRARENETAQNGSDGDDSSDDSDGGDREEKKYEEFGAPPLELMTREEAGDRTAEFVSHFIRYVLGVWKSHLLSGKKIEGDGLETSMAHTFNSMSVMKKTEVAVMPLLTKLRRKEIADEMLKQLDLVVSLAVERDYASCIRAYVNITMGKKTWFQALPQMMMQQNHGGSVARIIKQSELIDFDKDPIINAYIVALKRLIQFAQWLRPPSDSSKASRL